MSGHGELEISAHEAGHASDSSISQRGCKAKGILHAMPQLSRSICITTACTQNHSVELRMPCKAGTDAGVGPGTGKETSRGAGFTGRGCVGTLQVPWKLKQLIYVVAICLLAHCRYNHDNNDKTLEEIRSSENNSHTVRKTSSGKNPEKEKRNHTKAKTKD